MEQQGNHSFSKEFRKSFDFLWEKVIAPTIVAGYESMDEEFKARCNCGYAYSNLDDYKNDLMSFYREKREWLKKVYLPHNPHPRLDAHKLGAVLCRSMLAYKPIYFRFDAAKRFVENKFQDQDEVSHTDWFVQNLYVNYRIAFYVSIGIVYLNLLFNYQDDDNENSFFDLEGFEYFRKAETLKFYPKSPHHDSFENSCIIALQKNDILGRNFDYLTYAIMLFQIESYNRKYFEAEYPTANDFLKKEFSQEIQNQ